MVQPLEPGPRPESPKQIIQPIQQEENLQPKKGDAGPYGEIQTTKIEAKIPKKSTDHNEPKTDLTKKKVKPKIVVKEIKKLPSIVTIPTTSGLYKPEKQQPIRHERDLLIPLGKKKEQEKKLVPMTPDPHRKYSDEEEWNRVVREALPDISSDDELFKPDVILRKRPLTPDIMKNLNLPNMEENAPSKVKKIDVSTMTALTVDDICDLEKNQLTHESDPTCRKSTRPKKISVVSKKII